jgi:mannose-6-phosphate isomerase-like protein (cupin superfamily)
MFFIKSYDDSEKWLEKPMKEPNSVTVLTDLLHPDKDNIPIGYSLAEFVLVPGARTIRFRLIKASDVMIVLQGSARVEIDSEEVHVKEKQMLFIPPGTVRCIFNAGNTDLKYLSVAEPAFDPKDSEILEPADIQIIPGVLD